MDNMISIIVPVYNEQEIINLIVKSIQTIGSGSNIEILVVDGHDAKTTLKVIEDKSVIKLSSKKGRALQMNKGAIYAKGSILVFLHADTMLPPGSFDDIKNAVYSKKYKAGAFDLGIDSNKLILKIIEFNSSLRSRISRIPYGDQALFFQKEYFLQIGKFPEVPILEDFIIMNTIKKKKDKICILQKKCLTSARRWEKEGWLSTTLRNWSLIFKYKYFNIKPELLAESYPVHKEK